MWLGNPRRSKCCAAASHKRSTLLWVRDKMNFNGTFTQVIDNLVQRVMPALVIVRGHRFGAGAGIVWDASGLILTNNHVVGRRTPVVILQDDHEYESKL